jgi:lysyl-tRNA synthetase class 2
MKPVESSFIGMAGYHAGLQRFQIVLKSGRAYVYAGVSTLVAAAFEQADSKGEFYNAHIKGRYSVARVL